MKDTDTTIDLGGWSTAAAVTYTAVNEAIAASSGVPTSFSVAAPDGTESATGTFGTWALTLGGSGGKIQMQIAITGGTMTGPFGTDGATTTLTASPCAYPVTIQAQFLPQSTSTTMLNLQADGEAAVEVGEAVGNPPFSDFLQAANYQALFAEWLQNNLGQFTAVFATVDLDADYSSIDAGLSWLAPTYQGYAVAEPALNPTLDNSVFGVLSMIDGDDPTGVTYEISSFAIPAGSNAGFLISSQKFLQHMMFVAVPYMFSGITDSDPSDYFVINNGGTTITNTQGLTLLPFTVGTDTTVNPTIAANNFTITLDGTQLQIQATGMEYSPSLGIDVTFSYTSNMTLGIDTTNNVLSLSSVSTSGGGEVNVTEGLEITEIVLGVVAILASIVAAGGGALVKAASSAVTSATTAAIDAGEVAADDAAQVAQVEVKVLGGLINGTAQDISALGQTFGTVAKIGAIGAFVTGTVPAIMQIVTAVDEGNYQKIPPIGNLTSAAVGKTVIWPDAVGTFTLGSAQLNGALQFGLVNA